MQAGLGPLAATGVALVSAGAIAIAPVSPPPEIEAAPAVQLAAESDWSVIFSEAAQSAGALANSYFDPAFPVEQQIIANQLSYLGQLPDIAGIIEQIGANAVNGINAPAAATTDTLDDQHAFLYNALPVITQIPLVDLLVQISPTGQQLLDFATSPLSGVLLGIAGPVVGPAVVLAANLQSAIDDITADTPDPARALNTLLNTPAQMTDAFLNGGVHMDVTSLVGALGPSIGVTFPEGTKIGIAFGGLLSPGGSAFNALDMDYDRDILGLPIIRFNLATGQGPGFFGSLIDMNQAIARAIGWDGGGNPLAPAEEPSARNSLAPDDEVAAAASSTTLATPETPSGQDEAAAPASGAAAPDAPTDAVDPTDGAGESAVETATSDYHGRHRKEDVEWVADQLDSTTEDLDGENTAGAVALQDDEPDMSEDVEPADDAEVVEDSAADGGLDTVAQADDDETSGNHEDAEGADESDAAPGADDTSGDGGQSAGSGSTRAAA